MNRTHTRALCTTVLAFAVMAPAAQGHEGVAPGKCGKKRAATALRSEDGVRVVVVSEVFHSDTGGDHSYYACLPPYTKHARKHGFTHRRFIGKVSCNYVCSADLAVATTISLQDPKVALAHTSCSSYSTICGSGIHVVGLRSGRRASAPPGSISTGPPLYFDLSPGGTAVWMEQIGGGPRSIRGVTIAGESLLFDEGPARLSEMALANTTLYWMRDGQPQSAPVP